MKQEIWKTVYEYQGFDTEGLIKVSDLGNVQTFRNGKWEPQTLSKGTQDYLVFQIRNSKKEVKTIRVHVLVCLTFIGPKPTPEHKADHIIEGNPTDNRASNLRWATTKENNDKATAAGAKRFGRRRPTIQKTLTGEVVATYPSLTAASKAMGKNYVGGVKSACGGRIPTYLGFKWEYAD